MVDEASRRAPRTDSLGVQSMFTTSHRGYDNYFLDLLFDVQLDLRHENGTIRRSTSRVGVHPQTAVRPMTIVEEDR